jgi:hypothetical protein
MNRIFQSLPELFKFILYALIIGVSIWFAIQYAIDFYGNYGVISGSL